MVGGGGHEVLLGEGVGQQVRERECAADALGAGEMDRGVRVAELAQALAAAAARRDELGVRHHDGLGDPVAAAGDERPDGRRLRALALGIGGVLDVRAGVQTAGLVAQGDADGEVRIGHVGARHRAAGEREEAVGRGALREQHRRVALRDDAVVGDAEDLAQLGDARVLGGEVRLGGRDRLQLHPAAEAVDIVEVDAHVAPEQQPAALDDLDGDAERRAQRRERGLGVRDVGQVVGGEARGGGVRALVADELRARVLDAELEAAVARSEVDVALVQDALVGRAVRQGGLQRRCRIGVARLELDVAPGVHRSGL